VKFYFVRRRRPSSNEFFFQLGLGVVAAMLQCGTALGQAPSGDPAEFWRNPPISPALANALCSGTDAVDVGPVSRTPHIQMFRMLPGFLSDMPSLNAFDDPSETNGQTGNPDGFVLNFGDDNPYFDPRRPGDPGGVGYLRVHSQLQLVDWGSTSVCFGLRAWTPAGLESGGVQQGRTVVAPGLGVFHDLGEGTALHGFVDQSIQGAAHQGPLNCGMAVHCPLAPLDEQTDQSVFVFVQALGRYEYASDRQGRPMTWEVVPGLHWRVSDAFWMSLGASRSSMLTCWWHF